MSNVLRIALVDPDETSRETLKSMLVSLDTIWLEADCSRYEFFPDVVTETAPDVAFITLDSDTDTALRLVNDVSASMPKTTILAASSSADGQVILGAMRAGAKEFLTLPLSAEELEGALGRIVQAKFGAVDGGSRSSEVIVISGATGGVGSTSTAVNLASILANDSNNSVALVDLDLALGDADVFLDSIPDYTLADVVQNVARLDIQLLKKSLTKHSSGLYLLPRPVELADSLSINADSIRKVIGLMKASFTHVVVDVSKGYTSVDMAALEAASKVLLVTQLDLPCLRNVVRLMMSFEEFGTLKENVEIVVNRAGLDSGQISLKKAKETLGRDIFALLPNDYRTMVEVRNNGVPLVTQAPKAAITQAIRELADRLTGAGVEEGDGEDEAASSGAGGESSWRRFWPVSKG
ncbi:MAG: AAA family ATPase [Planctomycetota bacterium]